MLLQLVQKPRRHLARRRPHVPDLLHEVVLLAARWRDSYVYVGGVGTGFKREEARQLRKTLDRLKARAPTVRVPGKNLVVTSPTLSAEIEYRTWTHDGKLRHASYKGLRERQDNADIYKMPD